MMVLSALCFAPEFILAIGLLLLLLVKPMCSRDSPFVAMFISAFYLASLLSALYLWSFLPHYDVGRLFVADHIGFFVRVSVLVFGLVVLRLLPAYIRDYRLPECETYFLVGVQTLGMMLTSSCANWISLFIGLELMYLPLYALVAIKAEDPLAQEASCKYIIMSAFSTGLLLYGISLIYAVVGGFDFAKMADFYRMSQHNIWTQSWMSLDQATQLFSVGGLLVTIAFCFKLGVVPFHFWVRDVYQGGLYIVTSLISSAPKLILVVVWLRVFSLPVVDAIDQWYFIVFSLGVISLYFGHFVALVQDRIRSLLAYSSLAHMGFVLLALGLASHLGNQAAVVYTLGYSFTVFIVFLFLGCIRVHGRELDLISDLAGLSVIEPRLSLLLTIAFLSLLGMPPLVGFMLKVSVLNALVVSGQSFLAVVSMVPTAVAAYYYIQVINLMYFHEPDDNCISGMTVRMTAFSQLLLGLSVISLVLLGLYPESIFALVRHLSFG